VSASALRAGAIFLSRRRSRSNSGRTSAPQWPSSQAGKLGLEIGQPDIIVPTVSLDHDRMRTVIIAAIDEEPGSPRSASCGRPVEQRRLCVQQSGPRRAPDSWWSDDAATPHDASPRRSGGTTMAMNRPRARGAASEPRQASEGCAGLCGGRHRIR